MPSNSIVPQQETTDEELDALHRSDRRRTRFKVAVGALVTVVLLAVVAVIAALTFSVAVDGHSMNPTLAPKDRLMTDFFQRGKGVKRFDLVGAQIPGVGVVVKRVVGLPGDRVSITVRGDRPVVVVRPAGGTADLVVDNPTWAAQVNGNLKPCCTAEGKNQATTAPVVVPAGEYWVIGDNWGGSDDSRVFGFVTADQIGATLNFRILPLGKFGRVPNGAVLAPEQ